MKLKGRWEEGSEINTSKNGTHYWNVAGCSGTANLSWLCDSYTLNSRFITNKNEGLRRHLFIYPGFIHH
jgi:hypothetical protein